MTQARTPGGEAPSRRWWRRRRVRLIVLGILVAVGYWVGTTRLDGWLQRALENQVRTRLGGELTFERFELHPARLRVTFDGARLLIPDHPLGRIEAELRSASIQIRAADLLALAAGKIRFSSMELEQPTLSWTPASGHAPAAKPPPGTPRPWEIRIGRLRVVDGSFTYMDRRIPLTIDARRVAVEGGWSRLRSTLEGSASFAVAIDRPPLRQPLRLGVESSFRLDRHGMEIRHASIHGEGLTASFEGSLGLAGGASITGRGDARWQLERLGALLPEGSPRIAGDISSSFTVESSTSGEVLLGSIELESASIDDWHVARVTSRARLTSGRLELSQIVGESLQGAFDGAADLSWNEGQLLFDLRLDSHALHLADLLTSLGIGEIPLDATLEGSARIGGALLDRGSWDGGGTFNLSQTKPDNTDIPLSGPVEVLLQDGLLTMEGDLQLSASRARSTVEIDLTRGTAPTLQVDGHSRNFRDTQLALMHILSEMGTSLPAIARVRLDGSGTFHARYSSDSESGLTLGLSIEDGHFGRQSFDRLEMAVDLRDGHLKIESLEVTHAQQHFIAEAALMLDPLVIEHASLTAQGVSMNWLATAGGLALPADGTIDAELSFSAGRGGGRVVIRDGQLYGQAFDRAEGTVRFSPDRIDLERWQLRSAAAAIEGNATWETETGHWALNIDSGRGQLALLPSVERERIPLEGSFELRGAVWDEGDGVLGNGEWSLSDAGMAGVRIGSVRGNSEFKDGRLQTTLTGEEQSWRAETTISFGARPTLEARVELDEWVYELAAEDPDAGWALLSGEARIVGPLGEASGFQIDGRIEALELWRGNQGLHLTEPFDIDYEAGRFAFSPMTLAGSGTRTQIDLSYDSTTDRLDASAIGTFDLGLLVAGWPELRAAGPVTIDLRIDGPLKRPRLNGVIRGESGRVRWLGFGQRIEDLNWEARFDGSHLRLERLRARLGTGEILGQGQFDISSGGTAEFSFDLDAANVRLEYPEGFRGIYEGELSFAGTPQKATLAGEIRLLRGVYGNEFALGGGSPSIQASPDTTLPDWIDLDVDIRAQDQIWVRNELAQLESSLELNVGGSLRRPQLTGRALLLEGGELRFRDVEYDVISGSLDLLELERIDPYLTLRARTQVDDYTVYLRVEGTADNFEFDLTSEPSLTTPDIIALLTTGRTLGEISGQGSDSASGDLAANYFGGALTDPFERQLENLLGLNRVRIDPFLAKGESDPTTRLTIGEEVTDRIYVIFSTDLTHSENQLYSVTWKATPRMRIGIERDTKGGVGGDIRYTARFWLDPPPANPPEEAVTGERGQRLRVNSIRIEGVNPQDADQLRKRLPFSTGDQISRTSIFRGVESLKRWCVRNRLLMARIDAEVLQAADGADILYRVAPGPRVSLRFEGLSDKQEKRLLEALEMRWIDAVFVDELFEDTRKAILAHFQEQGHYAADVTLDHDASQPQHTVTYRVDLGRPVRIGAVEIIGIDPTRSSQLRGLLELRPTSMLSRRVLTRSALARDADRIRAFYRNEGYLNVQVADPSVSLTLEGASADVSFSIEEGPRFVVGHVAFSQLDSFSTQTLADWASIRPGDVFSGPQVLQAESRLRARIDAEGYPDVRVSGLTQLEGHSAQLDFQIVPGQRQTIASIEITGNRLTQEKIVRRELKLAVGDEASRNGLLESQHALYRLGIFRNVRLQLEAEEGESAGARRLRVHVEEEPPMSSTVAVGWDSEARARLGLSLTHDNVGGYDRVLSIQGKLSSLEQRIQLVGEEPRFLNRPLKALFSVSSSRDEEEGFAVSRATSAFRIEKTLNPRWLAFARYSFQHVNLSDVTLSPSELEEEKLVDGRLGDLGLGFVRDTRDNPFSPTRGSHFAMGGRLFARQFGSEFDFLRTSGNVSFLFGLSPRTAFATGLRMGVAIPYGSDGAVPISEAFFAGGDSTVRGFARDTLGPASGGEALLIINQEYRFPIWGNLRGVVFHDAGNIWATRSEIDSDLRNVLGAGLRYETPVGPLRLEYGGKLDRRPGESSGEFFLAIGNAF